MSDSINSLSPNFRDILLLRNVISDSIINSGLEPLLQGIGTAAAVSHIPEAVQPSEDIEVDGVFYKDLDVVLNKYQGTDDDYAQRSMNFLPGNSNQTWAGAPFNHESYYIGTAQLYDYTKKNVPASGPFLGGDIREFNTLRNNYVDISKQIKINLETQPVPSYQIGAYLDEYGALNIGGPDTQPLDIIGSLLTGGGVGFDPNGGGLVSDFDVRSSLSGRLLSAGGAINDTRLGQLGGKYLAAAIGNNIAHNLQEETIGRINLNPLSLLKGNNIIVPNYNITVGKGFLGKALDLTERMLGFETPVSLLSKSSSIFGKENPVSNITRAQSMVLNTGKGQVLALIANLEPNVFKYEISDDRKKKGTAPKGDDGTNGSLYAFNDPQGGIEDLLHTVGDKDNEYEKGHGKITSELAGGFNDEFETIPTDGFNWVDDKLNKERKTQINYGFEETAGNEFKNKHSILKKTQDLFKSNKMKTLVSGREDLDVKNGGSGVRSAGTGKNAMSKGSGVLSTAAYDGDANNPMFCRTWSSTVNYNRGNDLIRHSGLNPDTRTNPGANLDASVLGDAGFVKIGPYTNDKEKYMFSIENLAWQGVDSGNLSECEKGTKAADNTYGRIMWFPPYDISFNETTSVTWERNNFIGRGEPLYTYNNTERTGTLSWKIIVDHPNYMNYFPSDWDGDKIASFFAGCLEVKELRDVLLTDNEKNAREKSDNTPVKVVTDDITPQPINFTIHFKNDATDIPTLYENGLVNKAISGATVGELLGYTSDSIGGLTGKDQGLGTTQGEGIVGLKSSKYNDNTNFGINGQKQPLKVPNGNNSNNGWMSNDFKTDLAKYIKGECKYCRIKVTGYASTQGDAKKNQTLSELRAASVAAWLTGESGIIGADDLFGAQRIKISKSGAGETGTGCNGTGGQDKKECKEPRKAVISIEYDAELKELDKPTAPQGVGASNSTLNIPASRFFTECNYFKKLEESDPFVYESIKQKIPFFQPAMHSTSPEGFNSRLTFLNQCTRQGPTLSGNKPTNLAFGRPPVCILRLGDFYHTKIIIESL